MTESNGLRNLRFRHRTSLSYSLAAIVITLVAPVVRAQNLNWEGQTGALVTPFAYTASSPARAWPTKPTS